MSKAIQGLLETVQCLVALAEREQDMRQADIGGARGVEGDGLAANPANVYLLTLDDVIASEGGIPLVSGGKIIGAIGCSGGTGQQDGVACQAGANALK